MDWTREQQPKSASHFAKITVNVASRPAFLTDIEEHLAKHIGFSVATLNLDHVVKLRAEGPFRDAYQAHTHVTADGNPIVWLSSLSGKKVDLIPGSELIEPLAQIAARMDVPVAFLGSSDASLQAAEETLVARYPGLRIVARISPQMGFDPVGPAADEATAQLKAAGAQLVFLALGAPKQEIFAARAQLEIPDAGFLSIGAGLDFIAGTQTRAPKIARMFAIEWLWRLILNPTRLFSRYLACLTILPGLVFSALQQRRKMLRD